MGKNMKIDLDTKLAVISQQTKASDIHEHLPTLRNYASRSKHITEMGVRGIVSTWAFLAGKPNTLRSYDLFHPSEFGASSELNDVINMANENHIDFKFIQQNVLEANIAETDLLFIDTWHVYKQLTQELRLHSHKVRKFIILHDTTSCAYRDEQGYEKHLGADFSNPHPPGFPDGRGIWPAVEEFIHRNKEDWEILERFTNCNGLTVLQRITNQKSY
tara:strand:+ start:63 stop:713 length:651 start_codon:yes stop_codon:yes gene_type:complete